MLNQRQLVFFEEGEGGEIDTPATVKRISASEEENRERFTGDIGEDIGQMKNQSFMMGSYKQRWRKDDEYGRSFK